MREARTDPLLGCAIAGRYRIEAKIGEGGMGSVYRARNIVTGKVVAIKVLLQDLAAYESFVQRFLHEARAAAYLNHPHAINIIDCGQDGGIVYLLMEYVEGRTLTQVMREEGPLPAERVVAILRQICAAVADAHAQSIVHRDLKPDNIMLQPVAGQTDYVKVLDFGIAKVLDEQKRGDIPVSRNIFVGTPEYASPEQCNSKSPTHLSDVYSLGTILYEMLTGTPPFTGDPIQVMFKHVNEQPLPVRELRPDLNEAVEIVLERALSKNPAARPQHVLELAQEFEAAVSGELATPGAVDFVKRRHESVGTIVVRSRPTEIATVRVPPGPIRRSLDWLTGTRQRQWVTGIIALAMIAGTGAGYRFYRWYQVIPHLPAPPRLVLPLPPPMPAHPLAVAYRLFSEGNREAAGRELNQLIEHDRGFNPQAHALLGRVYFDQGDFSGATKELTAAVEQMNGVYPEARYWLGQLLLERGDAAAAMEQFRKARENSQGQHLPTLVVLVEMALSQNNQAEVEALFRQIISQATDAPEDVLQVGRVLMARRQYDLAERELRRASASNQGVFPEAELALGQTLLGKGEIEKAIAMLNQAITHRAGNYSQARMVLGLALYEQRKYDEAIRELQAAIHLRGGSYPQTEYLLGMILADWAVGQYEESQRQLQLAITHRGGDFPEAEQSLARLLFARIGQVAGARRIWTQRQEQTWLDRTEGASIIRAGPGAVAQRLMGSGPLKSGQSLTFLLTPLPAKDQSPTVLFKLEGDRVRLDLLAEGEGQPKRWRATALTAEGERLLPRAPVDNQLMGKLSVEVSISIDGSQAVLGLDGEEVGSFRVNPPVQVLISVGGGHAIISNLREFERAGKMGRSAPTGELWETAAR